MPIKTKHIATGALIIVIPGLVVLRSLTGNHFKTDAELHARPSYNHSIVVTHQQVDVMPGNKLMINLDGEVNHPTGVENPTIEELHSDPELILNRGFRKRIMNFKGNVFLVSDDPSLSSGLWMILSQMGRKDLFIVSDNADPEVFKYEFRPDTLILPEF